MFEEEKRRKKECGTKIPFINVSNPMYFSTKLGVQFGLTCGTARNLIS
jgi:hypothetical protein